MPKEGVRRVRRGTRSCRECRLRKVKCEWAGDDAPICNNCVARSRTCVAQGPASPVSEAVQLSSRDRIGQLETQVASLWSVVHKLETNARHGTAYVSRDESTDRPYYMSGKTKATSGETLDDDVQAASDTDDSEPDGFNLLLPSNQPSHLRQLFDNGLLDAQGSRDASWQTCDYPGHQSASKTYLTIARRQLQKILPPRDDVAAIAGFSFPWMSIYNALFPRIRFMATAEEMLEQYDELCKPNANPMSLANLLISLALSIRQIPEVDLKPLVPGIPNATQFIENVTEIVDRTIASNDTLAATLEGIETSLLFIRL
jgi:hypothetical protein